TGDGLSSSQPFRVSGFWAVAAPGKTLCLLDGTYQGAGSMIVPPAGLSGTGSQPITLRAINDGAVYIDGQSTNNTCYFNGNSYFVVSGFNCTNVGTGTTVVQVYKSNNMTFRRMGAYNAAGLNNHCWLNWDSTDNLYEDIFSLGLCRNGFQEFGTLS